MRNSADPETAVVIVSNRFAVEAARDMIAKAERERERLRVAIEESGKLRDQWRSRFRAQAERTGSQV